MPDGFILNGRILGPGRPVYLIAEIGVNHCGDLDLALKSIDAAVEAGADAVKFQSFRAEEFMADRKLQYVYESGGQRVSESMYEMFKRLELPVAWHERLRDYAAAKGADFLSSAADAASAELLAQLGTPALKLASEDLVNLPLLRQVAGLGKPVMLSTGMAEEFEIARALRELSGLEILLLHCVSLYPTPDEEANLLRLRTLSQRFGLPVGYSDHTRGVQAGALAVALGALCVEKHFTLDRALPGPDHAFSSDPEELAALRRAIDQMATMLGSGEIAPGALERQARLGFRRSVVAAEDLEAGRRLRPEDLRLMRPHTGLHPHHMDELFGRRLARPLAKGAQLSWEDLED